MFFVLGMPRSRTYWLSQFLGCTHEGLWYYPNYKEFLDTGQSDSTTCYPWIKDYIKDYKKVVIHRDEEDVKKSLKGLFGIDFDCSSYDLDNIEGLHIQYDDINNRLEQIWDYCRDDEFPTKRAEIMKDQVLNNEFLIREVQSCL